MKELCEYAIEIATHLGADYSDIRITDDRSQRIMIIDRSPKEVKDENIYGFGVRVLKNGAWGFASSNKVRKREIEKIVKRAFSIAKASSLLSHEKGISLAPEPIHKDRFVTPIEIDPFNIGMDEKASMLLTINEKMLKVKSIVKAISFFILNRRKQFFASQEGSFIEIEITTVNRLRMPKGLLRKRLQN